MNERAQEAAALIAKIRKRGTMRLGYAEIVYLTIAERDLIVAALSAPPPLRAREEIARALYNWEFGQGSCEFPAWDHESTRENTRERFRSRADAVLAVSSTAGQEWRDISSAPTTEWILGWRPGSIVRDMAWLCLPPAPGYWTGMQRHADDIPPTHWMPLPAPPVAEPKAKE